jgi:predicted Zn-dependent peptidase
MKLRAIQVCVAAVALLTATVASAQGFAERVIEHRLANGLTLLLLERHAAPVVACNITFKVGGVNETPGATGVAHLFEHMAFKGTPSLGTSDFAAERRALERVDAAWAALRRERAKGAAADAERLEALQAEFEAAERAAAAHVVPNAIAALYARHGGLGLNASTGKDVTRYMVSLPANRLELWAAIESDRMANPVLREFYKEKEVVLEERRTRYEASPSGKLYEAFLAAAFWAHPYGMPVIGWTSDLQALSRATTEAFFETYYTPNNAVIALVGDIEPQATIALIERTFGRISPRALPEEAIPVEPAQSGERRVEVEFAAEPALMIGYHRPDLLHPDDPVFDVIDALLSDGRSSRLYRSLVTEKRLAVGVTTGAGTPGAQYPHLFSIEATPRAPHTTDELEAAIESELDRLKHEPIAPEELQKVLTRLDAALVRSLRSNGGMASLLAYFQALTDDWRYLLRNRDAVARVTAEDVHRVARATFARSNRVVATLARPESGVGRLP